MSSKRNIKNFKRYQMYFLRVTKQSSSQKISPRRISCKVVMFAKVFTRSKCEMFLI